MERVRIMSSLEDDLDRLLVSFKDAKVRETCITSIHTVTDAK